MGDPLGRPFTGHNLEIKMIKILVVDDDPVIQKFLHEILRRNGYEVSVVNDGEEAMLSLRNSAPDLMILDIMMPNMNGYDVCRAVKFDLHLKQIPIILLTALDQEIQSKFLKSLGIEYLNKTCTADDILNKIKELLKI